jgi:dephospho-CoA kinase
MFSSEIESRLAAQASPSEREAVATYVIENSGDEDQLLRKVENLWEELQRLSK